MSDSTRNREQEDFTVRNTASTASNKKSDQAPNVPKDRHSVSKR